MSTWKVIAAKIELLTHPDAEKLMIAKVVNFSLVVGKDNGYKDNDIIFFAPDKSILPEEIRDNYKNTATGVSYLKGPNHDRVSKIRLRGVDSEGVTLNRNWVLSKLGLDNIEDVPLNEDLSEKLGISKYEPPIPVSLAGKLEKFNDVSYLRHHDVENYRLYSKEIQDNEEIIATEKIHGSQIIIVKNSNNIWQISSKGISKKDLSIIESPENLYWKSFRNMKISDEVEKFYSDKEVQIFGEAVPCQKGFDYGIKEPKLFIFRIMIDGQEMEWEQIKNSIFADFTVPVLHEGPFKESELLELAKGKETISGKALHIKEGIVIKPKLNRRSKEGFWLFLKMINPKYLETGEEIS